MIRHGGWGHWEPRVEGQAPASMAAALYVITGIDRPWVLLPLHGALYAISAVSLYSIALSIGASRRLSWLILLPLFIFPSTAMAWGQIHKDIYSIAGMLLVLRFWIRVWKLLVLGEASRLVVIVGELLAMAAGIVLIVFVRPYLGQVVMLASLSVAIVVMAYVLKTLKTTAKTAANISEQIFGVLLVLAGVGLHAAIIFADTEQQAVEAAGQLGGTAQVTGATQYAAPSCDVWNPSMHLPASVDQYLARLACAREGFRVSHPGAGSNIDTHIGFSDAIDVILYIPRALQISFFAPFPKYLFGDGVQPGGGAMRLLVMPEILVLYLALPGMLLALLIPEIRMPSVIAFVFSLVVVLIYALTITNFGTLYRMRFGVMLIWILVGFIGWFKWLSRFRVKAS